MTPKAKKRRQRHGSERRWIRYIHERSAIYERMRSASYASMAGAFAHLFVDGLTSGIVLSFDSPGGPVAAMVGHDESVSP